jgi:hypothetical protein
MKNKYIRVWVKGTLVFVISHLLILVYLSLKDQSLLPLNLFYILDLHLLFPRIIEGTMSTVLSFAIVFSVFGFFYWRDSIKK